MPSTEDELKFRSTLFTGISDVVDFLGLQCEFPKTASGVVSLFFSGVSTYYDALATIEKMKEKGITYKQISDLAISLIKLGMDICELVGGVNKATKALIKTSCSLVKLLAMAIDLGKIPNPMQYIQYIRLIPT